MLVRKGLREKQLGSPTRTAAAEYCRCLVVFSNQMQYRIWFVWFRVLHRAQNGTVLELERCRSDLNDSRDRDINNYSTVLKL